MDSLIKCFQGKVVSKIENPHSSTIIIYFSDESDFENRDASASITLDFCVWYLMFKKAVMTDSNSENLVDDLKVIHGDKLSDMLWKVLFDPMPTDSINQEIKIKFKSGRFFHIHGHAEPSSQKTGASDSCLATVKTKDTTCRFLDNGAVSIQQHDEKDGNTGLDKIHSVLGRILNKPVT